MAGSSGCVHFEEKDLMVATNKFDERSVRDGGCKLGEGGFGAVYKGKLKCTEVAIKVLRIDKAASQAIEKLAAEQFETEVRSLTKYRHPNLVTLIGYHNGRQYKALVYEYLPNGTLEDALETGLQTHIKGGGITPKTYLPWMCRISIATDTARGLAYLHTADHTPLVHRDVKSANVLLDLAFRAKVGDFGLARALDENAFSTQTKRIIGTSGYIPREYYQGVITPKMDTFAFGVILLEILTGLPSYDSRRAPKDLVTYLEQIMDKGDPAVLCLKVDVHAGDWPSDSFVKLFNIAKGCVESSTVARPEMNKVYNELEQLMSLSAQSYGEIESYKPKDQSQ